MPTRQPSPDRQPSSPDADHRYTPVGQSHSWHPRHQAAPHQLSVAAASAGAASRGGLMSGTDSGSVRNSSGTYLQPVRQKAGAAAAAGAADGSWPPPPPPPPPPATDCRELALTLPPPRGGGALPVSSGERAVRGDNARSVELPLHDYEEVPANGHQTYARPQERSPSTDMTETAILLPQKLPQDQTLSEGNSAGRKCTNPLYIASEKLHKMADESGHFGGKSMDANGGFNNSIRRSTSPCCTQACTVGMLAILLSTAAVILTILPLFGINLISRGESQTYPAVATNDVIDGQISKLEIILKDLQAKVNKQESLLNETMTKASTGISLSRCRFYQHTATNGNTDWIPEVQDGTAIGAYCYMRSGDEWAIETQAFAGGPSQKKQYRCNCKSRARLYYCIITYWLCPDIL